MADLRRKKTLKTTSHHINVISSEFAFFIPFNNPDKTEEEVPYSDQQVCQCQIISYVGEMDFFHIVEAVEKIGLFQKALQMKHSR